jgi:ketosteroid isomerase-like protein
MSQANVDFVRAQMEAFNRGDIEAVLAAYDPAIEFEVATDQGRDSPDFAVYHGVDEVRAMLADFLEAFSEMRLEPERFVDGGDAVIVVLRVRQRGRASGAEVASTRYANVVTLREGKIVRVQDFPEPADAFAALGLVE